MYTIKNESKKRIRILHVLGGLGIGGIETWLMNILRQKPESLQFDFLLNIVGSAYEEEAKSFGCTIHHAPPLRQLRRYRRFLKDVLSNNKYDVLHAHGTEILGDIMSIAKECKVPVRVSHCHTTGEGRFSSSPELWLRGIRFRFLDRYRILKYATDIGAVSHKAGRFLVGHHWDYDNRCKSLYCGVPLDRFKEVVVNSSRVEIRKEFRIPLDALVVGQVGSLCLRKNQLMTIKVLHELLKRDSRYYLYLAGEGELRPEIERALLALNLNDHVFMPGQSMDIPALMINGFDAHVLPSIEEGFGVVGLEAVAAGLHTVCSDAIQPEFTEKFRDHVSIVSLKADPKYWADRVEEAVQKRISPEEGIALVEGSPFSIQASMDNLIKLYRNRLEQVSR